MECTQELREQIYADYHVKILRYMRAKVSNLALAEDLTADVFVKAYEKLEGFDDTKAALSTWIYTIARNRLIDYFRTRKVNSELTEDIHEESAVETDLLRREALDTLADALKSLDERERDIIIMRYYQKQTLTDIAMKMGISYSYVKLLHNKALLEMKKHFE